LIADDFSHRKPDLLTTMDIAGMSIFDIAVYLALAVAIAVGFRTGLLRSALTILAYVVAMPIAIMLTSLLAPQLEAKTASPLAQNWVLFFIAFLLAGTVLSKVARMALDDAIGADPGIGDRLGGATLGALRVVLIAVSLVVMSDQLVPRERQPAFLSGSQLKPLLSAAGQKGFRSLPPEVTAIIDRLTHERRS
jgi:membrane protein required for colicin V production